MARAVQTASEGLKPQDPPTRVSPCTSDLLHTGQSAQADFVADRPLRRDFNRRLARFPTADGVLHRAGDTRDGVSLGFDVERVEPAKGCLCAR